MCGQAVFLELWSPGKGRVNTGQVGWTCERPFILPGVHPLQEYSSIFKVHMPGKAASDWTGGLLSIFPGYRPGMFCFQLRCKESYLRAKSMAHVWVRPTVSAEVLVFKPLDLYSERIHTLWVTTDEQVACYYTQAWLRSQEARTCWDSFPLWLF